MAGQLEILRHVQSRLDPFGLLVLGSFSPEPARARTGVMIGNAGSAMWPVFAAALEQQPALRSSANPLDDWTRSVLSPLAHEMQAEFRHPSDGPPWQPFQRWARDCGTLFLSPLGLNIHPEYGLWSALRGALILETEIAGAVSSASHPCDRCEARPCLSACPVGAFRPDGYSTEDCRQEITGPDRAGCMRDACAARRACPVGADWLYEPDHTEFHMAAFRKGISRAGG